MMTSRLRATVIKEINESRTWINTASVLGCGFLQEELSCGKQRSVPSVISIAKRDAPALAEVTVALIFYLSSHCYLHSSIFSFRFCWGWGPMNLSLYNTGFKLWTTISVDKKTPKKQKNQFRNKTKKNEMVLKYFWHYLDDNVVNISTDYFKIKIKYMAIFSFLYFQMLYIIFKKCKMEKWKWKTFLGLINWLDKDAGEQVFFFNDFFMAYTPRQNSCELYMDFAFCKLQSVSGSCEYYS